MNVAGVAAGAALTPPSGGEAIGSAALGSAPGGAGAPFVELMGDLIAETGRRQAHMDQQIVGLATGDVDNVHDVVLSVAEADLMFRLLMEVRDRLVQSYQEIMRMQI